MRNNGYGGHWRGLRRRRGICVVAAVFMNGGAGPWTAAACGAVAREARSAAWRWTGGTRGDQANTFSDPRARGPRRTQEDLGGPGRTLDQTNFGSLEDPHTGGSRNRRTRKLGDQHLGPKKGAKRNEKDRRVSMYF